MSISWIIEHITWPLTEALAAVFAFLIIFWAVKNKTFSHLYEGSSKEGKILVFMLVGIIVLVVLNFIFAGH